MLYYTEVCFSFMEVPKENSVCIYISGCRNNCSNCHYPLLQQNNFGDLLSKYYTDILDLYIKQATCVCFMGEGACGIGEKIEFKRACNIAHEKNLKTCLYSGRDTRIEKWMHCFDYIKLGSYKKESGAIDSKTTNQRMYKKEKGKYTDITYMFWEEQKAKYNNAN